MKKKIDTKRLRIRPLSTKDLDVIHVFMSDPENTKYMIMLPSESKEETQGFLQSIEEEWKKEKPAFFEFGIELKGQLIGAISIYLNKERTEGELGWIIKKEYWRQGYAAEAAFAMKDYAIRELDLRVLDAHCDTENIPSSSLMKKIGLVLDYDDGERIYEKTGKHASDSHYVLNLPKSERRILLENALSEYGMEDEKVLYIRHNENITFRVENKYLLRIHKSIEGFRGDNMKRGIAPKAYREQELTFLEFLSDHGMKVQKPVRNQKGDLVTELKDGTLATMLTWIPGKTLDDEEMTESLCMDIGKMIYQFDCLSEQYYKERQGQGLLLYNWQCCIYMKQLIMEKAKEKLQDRHVADMCSALDFIGQHLKESEDKRILVHGDLSKSNILLTENGLVPIDFSLCGVCHPMMDIAGMLCCIGDSIQKENIINGYINAGGAVDETMIDCCFTFDILLGIVLHLDIWLDQEWFKNRICFWCDAYFGALHRGGKRIYYVNNGVEKNIVTLLRNSELGNITKPITSVSGGYMHHMYKVYTDSGIYAVKHLSKEIMSRPSALDNFNRAEKIESVIEKEGISIVPSLMIHGSKMQKIDEDYFYIFHWQEGNITDWNQISEKQCEMVGQILGRMHAICPEETSHEEPVASAIDWHGYVQKANKESTNAGNTNEGKAIENKTDEDKSKIVRNDIAKVLSENESLLNLVEQELNEARRSLPDIKCISNEDMDPKNVMWYQEKPYVIDLECLDYGNPVSHALQLSLQWSGIVNCNFHKANLKAFFKGYLDTYDNGFRAYAKVFGLAYSWVDWLEYNIKRALGFVSADPSEIQLGVEEMYRTIDRIKYIHDHEQDIKEALE